MPGCCGSGGEERTGNSQRRRRRWVLVTALVLIVVGCSVCVITVSVTVSQGKQMRFPYEGMALLAIGVGMMVVHSNCGVQKINRRVPRRENNGLPDTREPQRPPDAPPAYWTVFSLFSGIYVTPGQNRTTSAGHGRSKRAVTPTTTVTAFTDTCSTRCFRTGLACDVYVTAALVTAPIIPREQV
uniref:Uncharacterized protein n=1 Tax=Branchiostoma floridae TaxID=7739 RepID=C3YCX0_BRAFL|eukprot:XP_002605911.1 hypothetical protein BRAFLDRAFT_87415 [Branchiostoma floridae]